MSESASPSFVLLSNRLGFTVWSEENKSYFVELYSNPQVTEFIGGPFTAEQIEQRYIRETIRYDAHRFQYFPIFLPGSKEFVGCCGLREYDLDKKILEIGFHFLPSHWRRGYAKEAATAMIAYAFDTLAVNALFAGHNPNAVASKNLLEKLGFTFTHEEFYEPTGLMHPSYLLTRENYKRLE